MWTQAARRNRFMRRRRLSTVKVRSRNSSGTVLLLLTRALDIPLLRQRLTTDTHTQSLMGIHIPIGVSTVRVW